MRADVVRRGGTAHPGTRAGNHVAGAGRPVQLTPPTGATGGDARSMAKKVGQWRPGGHTKGLYPSTNSMIRLRRAMEKAGFGPTAELSRLVSAAYNAMHALNVEVHYLSCKSGVGRSESTGEGTSAASP